MNILYTTHCPMCDAISTLLRQKGIAFEICDIREHAEKVDDLKARGFHSVPVFYLAENDWYMTAQQTAKWIASPNTDPSRKEVK